MGYVVSNWNTQNEFDFCQKKATHWNKVENVDINQFFKGERTPASKETLVSEKLNHTEL